MQYKLLSNTIKTKATISLPSSKSISNRLLLLNALSYSPYEIKNLSDSDDTKVMLGVLNANSSTFDVGAAGTSMRFLTAFLSKIVGEWTITGSERMKQRPIKPLVDALNSLGAKIEYLEKDGYPPLKIYGSALKGGELELPGNISSQYISAILMIAPTIENGLTLILTGDIISKPYIRMTLDLMQEFGVKSFWKDNRITIPEAHYQPKVTSVESDWSAASYWYEMAALLPGCEFTLQGLKKISLQGDSEVKTIFESLGVKTKFSQRGVTLTHTGSPVKHLKHNFINEPDLAQTIATCCCLLGVTFSFSGLQSLKIKETDRIQALINELGKLGFPLETNEKDSLSWNGTQDEKGNQTIAIDTYKDHRMAMAFAPAIIKGFDIIIDDPGVVSKSYPHYWKDLSMIGIDQKEI